MSDRRFAAADLGAQSGRVARGRFDGSKVELELAHQFPNEPVWLPDGLHWNVAGLFSEVVRGLGAAADGEPLDGVGIDSWGCDYALLGSGGRMLGLPYHYRDPTRCAPEVMERAFARVPQHELYIRTGVQTMPINTVFQLVAEFEESRTSVADAAGPAARSSPLSEMVERIALIPDLFGLWLTGVLVNEMTAASTTGLLEARQLSWATDLIDRLGLPAAPFAGEVSPPGVELGPVLEQHAGAGATVGSIVRTVTGHDTASAFAATTLPGTAVLSSGTWSLLGIEVDEPQLSGDVEAFNLTNERGIGNTTRLLRNVMGMWLIEECRREWNGIDYGALIRAAESVSEEVPLFDPDDESLVTPGPMCDRIEALIARSEQPALAGRDQLVRSVLVSLACKYRLVLEQLEAVRGRRIEAVQIVGGAVRNRLLCRLTADITGRSVVAGPVEATLMGNLLVQLLALGEVATREEMRALAAGSVASDHYEPAEHEPAEYDPQATYERFLEVAGLQDRRPSQMQA
jgi:rhamnulokinase